MNITYLVKETIRKDNINDKIKVKFIVMFLSKTREKKFNFAINFIE